MTVDGVIDQTDRFIPDGEHEDESYDQLFAADAFVLGRKTCQGWRASGDHHRRQVGNARPTPAVTLIGDAAHLMPPVGQSANQGMLDWAELAIALSGSLGDVDTALRRCWTAMFERIAPVAQGVGADVVDVFRRLRPRIWLVLRLTDRRCTRRY